jgi:Type II secretion system (T2SS), protein E, N-terminal domain
MSFQGDALVVALADPTNLFVLDSIRFAVRGPIEIAVGLREDIDALAARLDPPPLCREPPWGR